MKQGLNLPEMRRSEWINAFLMGSDLNLKTSIRLQNDLLKIFQRYCKARRGKNHNN